MIKTAFKNLSKLEKTIYFISLLLVTISFLITKEKHILSFVSSMIGVTALIFLSKGDYLGHFISIVFAILYIIIAYSFHYYGEIFIYSLLMIPLAITNIISWKKNSAKEHEVKINKIKINEIIILLFISIAITIIFYFLLRLLDTTNLIISTISVFTTFFAGLLSIRRSRFYALVFILNDIVLIILWYLAAKENIMYLPNVICFISFLINDLYALINWKIIEKRQNSNM